MQSMPVPTLGGGFGGVPPEMLEAATQSLAPSGVRQRVDQHAGPQMNPMHSSLNRREALTAAPPSGRMGPTLNTMPATGQRMGGPPSGPIMDPSIRGGGGPLGMYGVGPMYGGNPPGRDPRDAAGFGRVPDAPKPPFGVPPSGPTGPMPAPPGGLMGGPLSHSQIIGNAGPRPPRPVPPPTPSVGPVMPIGPGFDPNGGPMGGPVDGGGVGFNPNFNPNGGPMGGPVDTPPGAPPAPDGGPMGGGYVGKPKPAQRVAFPPGPVGLPQPPEAAAFQAWLANRGQ